MENRVLSRYGEAMTDPTSLPNFPPPPDEHPLRGRVLDVLIDMGLAPDIDGDGDVAFKANEQQLFVRCSEGDFQIMRVFGQWQIVEDLASDVGHLLQTCNEVNLSLNCVKTGIVNNTLVVTGEHLVTEGADVRQLVEVTTQIILSTVQMWHERAFGEGQADGGNPEGAGSD